MKVNILFTSIKYYDASNIGQWIWYFKRYKNVSGFILRIFGIYFNVREKNATEKLIALAKK